MDRIAQSWWNLEKPFSHIFQKFEQDLEIPHRSWQTNGNLPRGWATATFGRHVQNTRRSRYARNVRRLAERSWSEQKLTSVVGTPQKPRLTATDDGPESRAVPEVREHENENEENNEDDSENEKPPNKPDDDDRNMQELRSLTQLQRQARDEERETPRNTREMCVRRNG